MRHKHTRDHGHPERPHHHEPEHRGGRHGRRPFDYGALRLLMLAMIEERPRHGYELIRAIEERSQGHYTPSPGVIYPTLAWLDDMGFVVADASEGRKSHRITSEGQAFLAANRAAVEALMTRVWTRAEADSDPIRAGMHAIKSALRESMERGEPSAELRAAIADVLHGAAGTIRAKAGTSTKNTQESDMEHLFTRHRFDTRRRLLVVAEKTWLTPRMIRFVLTSDDLGDFQSLAPDDHIKLFFETGAEKPEMRDYTPRAFDRDARSLTIDFAVHDAGPATRWAVDAKVGDTLAIGGPRGSSVVSADFDWWLLIGDETALPAMGRWAEELPPTTRVTTLGVVVDAAEEQSFAVRAQHTALWVHRPEAAIADPTPVLKGLAQVELPPGRGFIWIAAEAGVARAVRDYLLTDRGHPREWIKAAGYWVLGEADSTAKTIE